MSDDNSNPPLKNSTIKPANRNSYVINFASIGTIITVCIPAITVIFMIIFYHRYDLINNYIPNFIPNGSDSTHEKISEPQMRSESISRFAQSLSLRPVYLNVGPDNASYIGSLKQQFGTDNIQVTDDQTRSGITLQVAGDVSVKPSITVGSSQTWRAEATLSMEAFGTQDHSRLFGRSYHGQELATSPDAARERAETEAVRQLVADYKEHVQERRP